MTWLLRWSFVVVLLCRVYMEGVLSTGTTINNNGYEGVIIAINPSVPEDPALVESLKELIRNTSVSLFEATQHRAYFRNVTILVPNTWTNGTYAGAIQGESYSSADILVADPNPNYNHNPYTLQYGGCGQRGEYIHITPDYVTNPEFVYDNGPKGKVMVHEWAHLRWGVFDEGPTGGYQDFYLHNSVAEATRCPASLSGVNGIVDYTTNSYRPCEYDPDTGYPEIGCVFVPSSPQTQSGISASIMSHQFLEEVTTFCHSDASDWANLHNVYAPNEQNRLCNLRSIWDVILESDDFANGNNPAAETTIDTTPTINVVKTLPSRFVLVMDVSGSMATNDRITVMKRAAGLFVTDFVSDSALVGLVSFSTTATTLSELRSMTSSSRSVLKNLIDATSPTSTTAIGLGIREGLEVLQGPTHEYAGGGDLIVLTDGEENVSPYVEEVYDEVIASGARMYTVFLDLSGATENQIMTNLSIQTGGNWFTAYSNTDSTEILSNFQTLSHTDDGNDVDETYQIHDASFTLNGIAFASGTVRVDSSIGINTLFIFTWGSDEPQIVISSPAGCEYSNSGSGLNFCPDNPIHECDTAQRSCKFSIPGTALVGDWNYNISVSAGTSQNYTVVATSRPTSDAASVITVQSYLTTTDISTIAPAAIYAKVSSGFAPVLGANVTAVVTDPTSTEHYVQLNDNGAGIDLRKDDGIYSRYFFEFTSQGRYSLRILVSGTSMASGYLVGSPAAFNPGTISADGTFVANPNGLSNVANTTETNTNATGEEFDRVTSGGSFSYTGPVVTSGTDVFGPNQITDLVTTQTNASNVAEYGILIEVQFTAPGDDLDAGYASSYEIRYSEGNLSLLQNNFNSSPLVIQEEVVAGNLSSPQEGLSQENIIFNISNLGENTTQLFVAIIAYDDVGQTSGLSNIASVTITRQARTSENTGVVTEATESGSDNTSLIIGLAVGLGIVVTLGIAIAVFVKLHPPTKVCNEVGTTAQEYTNVARGMTPVTGV